MRVRFYNDIAFCTKATYRVGSGSTLLLLTTHNGVYTVNMKTVENAETVYNNLLINSNY